MMQQINLKNFKSFFIIMISAVFCINCYGKTFSRDTSINEVNDKLVKKNFKAATIDGYLNVLWMDTSQIAKIKRRIVFRFYAETADILILKGWINDDDNFDDNADVTLTAGPASSVRFGAGSYFGNIILKRDDSKALIRKARNRNKKFVILVPIASNDPDFPDQIPGQIAYKILLDDAQPGPDFFTKESLTLIKTGLSINPSPPRNPL